MALRGGEVIRGLGVCGFSGVRCCALVPHETDRVSIFGGCCLILLERIVVECLFRARVLSSGQTEDFKIGRHLASRIHRQQNYIWVPFIYILVRRFVIFSCY